MRLGLERVEDRGPNGLSQPDVGMEVGVEVGMGFAGSAGRI